MLEVTLVSTSMPKPRLGRVPKYPFETMPIYSSFLIAASEAPQFEAFKIYCNQRSRAFGKKFTPYKREDGSIEVYRRS